MASAPGESRRLSGGPCGSSEQACRCQSEAEQEHEDSNCGGPCRMDVMDSAAESATTTDCLGRLDREHRGRPADPDGCEDRCESVTHYPIPLSARQRVLGVRLGPGAEACQ